MDAAHLEDEREERQLPRESWESTALSTVASKKKARADSELANEEKSRRRWERNYSSEDSIVEDDESAFSVYYCAFCGAFALVLDVKLNTLPTRKTDGSRVLDCEKRTFRQQMVAGQMKMIKREKGIEKQCRFNCKECGLFLAYRPTPLDQDTKYWYIVNDAMTDDPKTIAKRVAAAIGEDGDSDTASELLKAATKSAAAGRAAWYSAASAGDAGLTPAAPSSSAARAPSSKSSASAGASSGSSGGSSSKSKS